MASQSSSRGAIITDLKADLNEKAKLHADLQSANVALSAAKSTTEIVQAEMKVETDFPSSTRYIIIVRFSAVVFII